MNVIDLFDGNVGIVMSKSKFNNKFGEFESGEEIEMIEYFNFDDGELFLSKGNGYRGVGCYEGVFVKGNEKYYVDVINEGVVCKLIKQFFFGLYMWILRYMNRCVGNDGNSGMG